METYVTEFHNLARVHYCFNEIVRTVDAVIEQKQANSRRPAQSPISAGESVFTKLLQDSLVLSVIQYTRPFKENRNSPGSGLRFPSQASKAQTELHQHLITLRDKAIAHSDGDFNEKIEGIQIRITHEGPVTNRLGYTWEKNFLALPGVDLSEYRALIGFLHDRVIRVRMLEIASELDLEPAF